MSKGNLNKSILQVLMTLKGKKLLMVPLLSRFKYEVPGVLSRSVLYDTTQDQLLGLLLVFLIHTFCNKANYSKTEVCLFKYPYNDHLLVINIWLEWGTVLMSIYR